MKFFSGELSGGRKAIGLPRQSKAATIRAIIHYTIGQAQTDPAFPAYFSKSDHSLAGC